MAYLCWNLKTCHKVSEINPKNVQFCLNSFCQYHDRKREMSSNYSDLDDVFYQISNKCWYNPSRVMWTHNFHSKFFFLLVVHRMLRIMYANKLWKFKEMLKIYQNYKAFEKSSISDRFSGLVGTHILFHMIEKKM